MSFFKQSIYFILTFVIFVCEYGRAQDTQPPKLNTLPPAPQTLPDPNLVVPKPPPQLLHPKKNLVPPAPCPGVGYRLVRCVKPVVTDVPIYRGIYCRKIVGFRRVVNYVEHYQWEPQPLCPQPIIVLPPVQWKIYRFTWTWHPTWKIYWSYISGPSYIMPGGQIQQLPGYWYYFNPAGGPIGCVAQSTGKVARSPHQVNPPQLNQNSGSSAQKVEMPKQLFGVIRVRN